MSNQPGLSPALSDHPTDEHVPGESKPDYTLIKGWLKGAERIWLPLHVSPDGDCLGSCLGFAHALRNQGYTVCVVSSDPVPDVYSTLCDEDEVFVGAVPPGPPPTHIACLDISDPARTGDFYEAMKDALQGESDIKILNLDHHATNVGFGDLKLIDTGAAACAEQIAMAIEDLGWEIDAEIANHLLLGIVTDTLGFRTPSTTARTLRIAADLSDCGGSLYNIVDTVFNTRPLTTLMLWSKALGSVDCELGGRVIFVQITPQMLEQTGAKEEELEGLSSYLASVRGKVKVAAVLKEREDGTTRVSLRSQPGMDVSKIAQVFGGGGHPQAAGATIPAVGRKARRLFLKACQQVLDQS